MQVLLLTLALFFGQIDGQRFRSFSPKRTSLAMQRSEILGSPTLRKNIYLPNRVPTILAVPQRPGAMRQQVVSSPFSFAVAGKQNGGVQPINQPNQQQQQQHGWYQKPSPALGYFNSAQQGQQLQLQPQKSQHLPPDYPSLQQAMQKHAALIQQVALASNPYRNRMMDDSSEDVETNKQKMRQEKAIITEKVVSPKFDYGSDIEVKLHDRGDDSTPVEVLNVSGLGSGVRLARCNKRTFATTETERPYIACCGDRAFNSRQLMCQGNRILRKPMMIESLPVPASVLTTSTTETPSTSTSTTTTTTTTTTKPTTTTVTTTVQSVTSLLPVGVGHLPQGPMIIPVMPMLPQGMSMMSPQSMFPQNMPEVADFSQASNWFAKSNSANQMNHQQFVTQTAATLAPMGHFNTIADTDFQQSHQFVTNAPESSPQLNSEQLEELQRRYHQFLQLERQQHSQHEPAAENDQGINPQLPSLSMGESNVNYDMTDVDENGQSTFTNVNMEQPKNQQSANDVDESSGVYTLRCDDQIWQTRDEPTAYVCCGNVLTNSLDNSCRTSAEPPILISYVDGSTNANPPEVTTPDYQYQP